jgi:hypothetical protein
MNSAINLLKDIRGTLHGNRSPPGDGDLNRHRYFLRDIELYGLLAELSENGSGLYSKFVFILVKRPSLANVSLNDMVSR